MTKNLKIKFLIFLNTLLILGFFSFPVFASNTNTDTQSIVDRINTLTSDILKNNTQQKVSILGKQSVLGTQDIQIEESIERKELMKELMKEDPILFNNIAMSDSDRNTLSSSIQDNIEQQSTISGKITTIAIDNTNQTSSYEYYIKTPQEQYSFYPTSDTPLLSSTNVEITGYILDSQLSTNTTENPVTVLGTEPPIDSIGNQRTLVLLVKSFPGDAEPFTPAQAQDLVFNGQFQNFMKEQSYNKVSFSGDVYGWVSAGQQLTSTSVLYGVAQNLLLNAVNTNNIDLSNYDRVVYLGKDFGGGASSVGKYINTINNTPYNLSKTVIGLGSVSVDTYDQPSVWGVQPFTWTNLDYTLSHELGGHGLGVAHANRWLCTDGQILYGNCSHLEYGNYYDTMGSRSYSLDYNAYFKQKLGWIPDDKIISITNSGTYTLNPLEVYDGLKLGAKVYISGITPSPYYLEFRKALGFDLNLNNTNPDLRNNQNGIFVNYLRTDSNIELLDMSPADDTKNVTLNLPSSGTSVSSFTDTQTGVTIGPVLSVSDSAISFKVNFAALTPVATPTAGIYEVAQTVSLSSSQSSYIRYTIDGSAPSCSVGTIYSTPINVSSSETIKALGCDSFDIPSSVATFVYVINSAPIVSNVIISGTHSVGQLITGSYSYTDTEGDIEGTSTFRWLRDDVAISGATSSTYTTTSDDAGKTIKFEVTPISLTGFVQGIAVQSIGISIPAILPIITTNVASSINTTSVNFNAEITSTGGVPITESGFKYGLTTDYTITTIDGPTTTGMYSKNITGLTCNTTYHFLAYAINSLGITLGSDQSFITSVCPDPDIAFVSSDKSSLSDSLILNQNSDILHITTSLTLPTSSSNGSTISWSSNNTSVISNTGVFTKPTSKNENVTLTATITKGLVSDTKVFNLTVLFATLSTISITTQPSKLTYKIGEALDISGLVVAGTYSDNYTKQEKISLSNITGFNSSAPIIGQVLTVVIGGKATTYTVDIVVNIINSSGGGSGGGSYTPSVTTVKPIVSVVEPIIISNSETATSSTLIKQILSITKILKQNTKKDNDVKIIQIYLNAVLKLTLTPDGIFGKQTKVAIMKFQKDHNLKPDGIVGPKTRVIMK